MKKFKGILARRMPEITQDDLMNTETYLTVRREKEEREEALIRHFRLSPEDSDVWYKVALHLAELVVPAYKPRRGRPGVTKIHVKGWAYYWVALRNTGTETDTEAFKIISELVAVDIKTVRTRLKRFAREYPTTLKHMQKDSVELVDSVGREVALEKSRDLAMNDEYFLVGSEST